METAQPGSNVPLIERFTADPAYVALGDIATLTWAVANAERCLLDPGQIVLPDPAGTIQVPVSETTVFSLTAIGATDTSRAYAEVSVAPVTILAFDVVPEPVAPGDSATLTWETTFATACTIDQGVGGVPTAGSFVVYPQQTTVYTLSAIGFDPATRSVTVRVEQR